MASVGAGEQPFSSRIAELVLDSGHKLGTPGKKKRLVKALPLGDKQSIELGELQRLCDSARDEGRRRSLHDEIEYVQQHKSSSPGSEAGRRSPGKPGLKRPWSARPQTGRLSVQQAMKTIPELKQHTRPLSSKIRGALLGCGSGAGSPSGPLLHSARWSADSSVSSVGSNEDCGGGADEELDRHEIRHSWCTSCDARHPVANVLDRNSATFWLSSGLFPHSLGFTFRRTIVLAKVMVYCTGVHLLCLHWRSAADRDRENNPVAHRWPHTLLSHHATGDDHLENASLTEFVFTLATPSSPTNAPSSPGASAAAGPHPASTASREATAVKLELLKGLDFAVVRHLAFVEQAGGTVRHLEANLAFVS